MSAVVTVPPEPVVTVEEAKAHLRVDHAEDDALIASLIAAATSYFDGPDGVLGRAIGAQTIAWRLDAFPADAEAGRIPYPRVTAIEAVSYLDADGAEQVLDPGAYRVVGLGTDTAWFTLASGAAWPATAADDEAVVVEYVAGYADGTVPAALRHAILMTVAWWYDQRETAAAGELHQVPEGADTLSRPFRLPVV